MSIVLLLNNQKNELMKQRISLKESLTNKDGLFTPTTEYEIVRAKLSIVSGILSDFKNKKIELHVDELTDQQELQILSSIAKKLKQELDYAKQAGRDTVLVDTQLKIVESFLPKQKSEDETKNVINELVKKGLSFGDIMKELSKDKGSYNMEFAKTYVREAINELRG